MHNKLKEAFLILLVLFSWGFAADGENYLADPATSGLSYLRLPVSARAAALGNTMVSMSTDVGGVLANPAIAGGNDSVMAMISQEFMTLDRSHYFVAAQYPLSWYQASVGLGYVQYGIKGFDGRDMNGTQTGTFSDLETTVAAWYGGAIRKNLFWGALGEYHKQEFETATAKGFSFGTGLLYRISPLVEVGVAAQNLGWNYTWSTGYAENISPSFLIGGSTHLLSNTLNIGSDVEWTPKNFPQAHLGVEYWIVPQFCVRAGTQAPNPIQGSGGIGIKYKALSIDYAFTYHQSGLGSSHLLSLLFKMQSFDW